MWKKKKHDVNSSPLDALLTGMDYDGNDDEMEEDIDKQIKYYKELIAKGEMK